MTKRKIRVVNRYVDAKEWSVVVVRKGDNIRHVRFFTAEDADAFAAELTLTGNLVAAYDAATAAAQHVVQWNGAKWI